MTLTLQSVRQHFFELNDPRRILLSEINDYTIYTHFIGREVKCGEFIQSPIRVDNTPSFNIYYPRKPKWDNQILFKDYSGPSGNVFQFVENWAMFNENVYLTGNKEVTDYIRKHLNMEPGTVIRKVQNPEPVKANNYFFSAYDYFPGKHKEYLNDLGIDPDFAKEVYNIYPCMYLMNEFQQVIHDFRGTLTFAYAIFDKFKLYQPYEENFIKFFNHCPSDYVQGFQQCKVKGQDTLIITKAMKDILVIQSHTDRWYDIVAPHGEGYNIQEHWIKWYLQYPRIVLMYDPDLAGIGGLRKLRKSLLSHPDYKGQKIEIKFMWDKPRIIRNGKAIVPVKDSADFRLIYGGQRTRERLKEILYVE